MRQSESVPRICALYLGQFLRGHSEQAQSLLLRSFGPGPGGLPGEAAPFAARGRGAAAVGGKHEGLADFTDQWRVFRFQNGMSSSLISRSTWSTSTSKRARALSSVRRLGGSRLGGGLSAAGSLPSSSIALLVACCFPMLAPSAAGEVYQGGSLAARIYLVQAFVLVLCDLVAKWAEPLGLAYF